MCGRYVTPDQAAIERYFGRLPRDWKYLRSYNVAPRQATPVLVDVDKDPDKIEGRGRSVLPMMWDFQPRWARRAWINARSETVFDNRPFMSAACRQRCVVPASGWYEWTGGSASRQPYYFQAADGTPLGFAGIWVWNRGGQQTFAILTTAAYGAAKSIHDRMPLILSPLAYDCWLWPQSLEIDYRAAAEYPADEIELLTYPVSPAVNPARRDSPECINPIDISGGRY
jgi:putative SOS response-associated peptidase YedK